MSAVRSTHTILAGLALATLVAPSLIAEPRLGPGGAILHEPVPSTSTRGEIPVFVYDPRATSELPQEIHVGTEVLPAPAVAARPTADERPYDDRTGAGPGEVGEHNAPPGFEPRGSLGNAARPDRDTGKEADLEYHASFDPSVVPFKRNRALNHVDANGDLTLVGGKHIPVPVIGHRVGAGREVFWGSVMVHARADEAIPLPTVAPDSRVLAYETEPKRELRFERDEADNLYVRVGSPGAFRLVYLLDADARYFARPLPESATVKDVPPGLRPTLPKALQRAGLEVADSLGLRPRMPYRVLVDGLVSHFRSFEAGAPPPETGDIYRDLALGKRGICRHRGYAFLITAHALGIPSRYVFNEAHVFVEIWIPGNPGGWVRADLGGGAENLTIEGGESRVRHRPRGGDPFSRPRQYAEQMAQGGAGGADRVTGMPKERRPRGRASTEAGESNGETKKEEEGKVRLRAAMVLPDPRASSRPSRVSLVLAKPLVYRGDPMAVMGRVSGPDGGRPRAGGKVQVVLRSMKDGTTLGLLGVGLTDSRGLWSAEIMLPRRWPPGSYDLRAEFLGDRELAPSVSP
jgi:hypothetical protein